MLTVNLWGFALGDFTVVADFHDACGECPLWRPDTESLYWTDITRKQFYRYDPNSKAASVAKIGFEISGFRFNEGGGILAVNSKGIWLWDKGHEPVLLAAEVDGISCRMNDCGADPQGRLVAGTCFFDPVRKDYPLGHLLLVDHDGSVRVLDDGVHLANGIGFSPDRRTLYFTDSIARVIYSYDYDLPSGSVSNRRELVKVPTTEGLPDGLTVDAEGFVWSAQWFGSCIVRYDPDGANERRIDLPAKQITSLAFGGKDLTDIYVTSAELPDCLAYAPPGYDAHHGNIGGALFLGNEGIPGKVERQCRIKPL
jgi:D-xylonolactonase